MAILVFVESAEGKIRKTSIEAVSYAHAMGGPVTAIAMGNIERSELEELGKFGAQKVLHVEDDRLNQGVIQAYTSVLAQAMEDEQADIVVLATSALGTPVAARLAARVQASLATNVISLPDTTSGFVVRKSIYTGKAFSYLNLTHQKKVIAIRKNAAEIREVGSAGEIIPYKGKYSEADFAARS